jgi:hypothetical protein
MQQPAVLIGLKDDSFSLHDASCQFTLMSVSRRAYSVKRNKNWEKPESANTKAPPDFSEGALISS